jgi:type II secretory pathway pseudopilin PulG
MTAPRPQTPRLRDERGFSLTETLAGMSVALVVLLAAFALLDSTVQLTSRTQGRVEAVARGRQAMDAITRQLRSQVCVSASQPSMISADGWSVTFWGDLGTGTAAPQRRVLTFSPTGAGSITEQVFATPAATPTTTTLLTDVTPSPDVPASGGRTPIFRYYAYDGQTPPRPEQELSAPLTAALIPTTARIAIDYAVRPTGATSAGSRDAIVSDEVFFRSTDPNVANPTPQCS